MAARTLRFGDFELDATRQQLRRNGELVEMRAQPLRLLLYLVENRDRTVRKDELTELLWPGMAVSDASLTSAVWRVRQTLGDDAEGQQWISTARGHGYRFVAEVEVDAGESSEGQTEVEVTALPPAPGQRRWLPAAAAAVGLLAVALAAARLWPSSPAPTVSGTSLLVLPFEDLSPSADHAYLARGMAEELIDTLTGVPGLAVMGRTTGEVASRQGWDIPEIGRRVGVKQVIEGSVRRTDDRLRVTIQLIRAQDGFHEWSRSYDRPFGDVLDIQAEIADAVAGALKVELAPHKRPTRSVEAWEEYRLAWALFASGTPGQMQQAHAHFERAVNIDPEFAPAHAALGESIRMLCFDPEVECDRAAAWAEVERALEIDPGLARAHELRAFLLADAWNWTGAEAAARHALELASPDNPTYASFLVAHLLLEQGQIDDALRILERLEAQDPLDVRTKMSGAGARLVMGVDLERALELLEQAGELAPALERVASLRPSVNRLLGRDDRALQELLESELSPEVKLAIRDAYAASGWPAVDPLVLDSFLSSGHAPDSCAAGSVAPISHMRIRAGDLEGALECLERGYRDKALHIFMHPGVAWMWNPIRDHPRFRAILEGMGLSDDEPLQRVAAYRDCSGPSPSEVRCSALRPAIQPQALQHTVRQ